MFRSSARHYAALPRASLPETDAALLDSLVAVAIAPPPAAASGTPAAASVSGGVSLEPGADGDGAVVHRLSLVGGGRPNPVNEAAALTGQSAVGVGMLLLSLKRGDAFLTHYPFTTSCQYQISFSSRPSSNTFRQLHVISATQSSRCSHSASGG